MQNPCHVLVVLAALALPAAAAPQIIQASDPVRPDEAVLVIGDAFGKGCSVEIAPLPDGPATAPREKSPPASKKWQVIQPLQGDERSLKFVVPKEWPQGVWACRVRQGGLVSEPVILNEPEAWWWNGDAGESATPGGWLRVFGKSLNFGGATADVIVEHCVVRHADIGIKAAASVKGVLLRDNTFVDVGQNEAVSK